MNLSPCLAAHFSEVIVRGWLMKQAFIRRNYQASFDLSFRPPKTGMHSLMALTGHDSIFSENLVPNSPGLRRFGKKARVFGGATRAKFASPAWPPWGA
ncbi:hypothetical protein ACVIHH_000238 [Bradyrhizobium sp. USDA 4518]